MIFSADAVVSMFFIFLIYFNAFCCYFNVIRSYTRSLSHSKHFCSVRFFLPLLLLLLCILYHFSLQLKSEHFSSLCIQTKRTQIIQQIAGLLAFLLALPMPIGFSCNSAIVVAWTSTIRSFARIFLSISFRSSVLKYMYRMNTWRMSQMNIFLLLFGKKIRATREREKKIGCISTYIEAFGNVKSGGQRWSRQRFLVGVFSVVAYFADEWKKGDTHSAMYYEFSTSEKKKKLYMHICFWMTSPSTFIRSLFSRYSLNGMASEMEDSSLVLRNRKGNFQNDANSIEWLVE